MDPQLRCLWTCQLELFTSISSRSILVTWTIPPSAEDLFRNVYGHALS